MSARLSEDFFVTTESDPELFGSECPNTRRSNPPLSFCCGACFLLASLTASLLRKTLFFLCELSSRCGFRLAISDQRVNILNTQPGICLIKTDRNEVDPLPKGDELLNELAAGRGRRILREFEDEIEDRADVFGEIGNVLVK